MPAATTVPKGTETSVKSISASKNRKPSKHQGHRYGRIRREGDEEIVREAQSDYGQSESENTDDEDSHSESSAVSMPDSHLPSSSQSQPTPGHSNGHDSTLSDASEPIPSSGTLLLDALRDPRLDWSDAVLASEGDVPVIQFGQLIVQENGEKEEIPDDDQTAAATDSAHGQRGAPPNFRRHVGMSARQVYLKRLENDPAYTPRVGEFWGHDERLLDKDLRSLSGWWRGKWTGGSRGGMPGGSPSDHSRSSVTSPQRGGGGGGGWKGRGGGNAAVPQAPVDPVDQAWKHDGFEEMKKVEEIHEARSKATSDAAGRNPSWAGSRGHGRGGIVSRGGSHLGRVARSNSVASPSPQSPQALVRPYGHMRAHSTTWNRYEHAWTKHAVSFLFQDALNRPKNGDEMGVRVKLPGQHRFNVVRIPKSASTVAPTSTVDGSPKSAPRTIVVKLPKPTRPVVEEQALAPENVRTVTSPAPPEQPTSNTPKVAVPAGTVKTPAEVPVSAPISEVPTIEESASTVENAMPHMEQPVQKQTRDAPALQLLTSFPESTPSPAYSSPSFGPGYHYPVPQPSAAYPTPGMLSNDQPVWYDPRMPYGYPTPPPLPGHHMYTPPQPVRHVHHHHSHSASHPHMSSQPNGLAPPYYGQAPDFHQAPPPIPSQQERRAQPPAFTYGPDGAMLDVHTGTPIFSLAKSAVKVAIRRPGESDGTSQQQATVAPSAHAPRDQSRVSQPGEASEINGGKEPVIQENVPQYRPQPHPEMTMPAQGFVPGHVHGHPSQQFWNGYPQAPNGYYYQQPMYGVPQPQEYMYGQPMQGPPAPPMHGYPQPHYGEGMEYQPHVYY